jgi:GTP-binding protein HflX
VNTVLEQVGAMGIPQLEVFNKADLIGEEPRIERDELDRPRRVWVSARTGAGTDLLVQAVGELLGPAIVQTTLVLHPNQGRARARLYEAGAVLAERAKSDGDTELDISMPRVALEDLCRTEGLRAEDGASLACAPADPFLQSRVPRPNLG